MIGKPIKLFKNRAEVNFEDRVIEIINRVMPTILLKHDHEVRITYLADRQKYLEEIKEEVEKDLKGQLNSVEKLTQQYKALEISAKDVLREKIVFMYENNKENRSLRHFERRALDQYYKDYKEMNGNSYIDIIYSRMKTWSVEADDYER